MSNNQKKRPWLIPLIILLVAAAMIGVFQAGAHQGKKTATKPEPKENSLAGQPAGQLVEQSSKFEASKPVKQEQPEAVEQVQQTAAQQPAAGPEKHQQEPKKPEDKKELTWNDIDWNLGGSRGVLIENRRLSPYTSENDYEIRSFRPTKEAGYPNSALVMSPSVVMQFKPSGTVYEYEDQRGIVAVRIWGYLTKADYSAPYPKMIADVPWGTFSLRIEAASSPAGPWEHVTESPIRTSSLPSMASFLPPSHQGMKKVYFRFTPVNWPEHVGIGSFSIDTGYRTRQ
ncbi:MAG: hypothetical protein K6U74_18125 [Firmicutes bacterium]|nr:hypothetical protein [Bacillota bacterium]